MFKLLGVITLTFLMVRTCLAEEYHFASIANLIEQDVGRLIIPEIYKRLDIDVRITPMSGSRAQKEATSGEKAGEIMRIWTYGEENPTTLRVPTPYYYLETMAFVRKGSGVVIRTKEDLRKYKLVKVRGVKHTNNISAGMPNVHSIKNTELMMKFLDRGRADVALTNTVDGLLVLKALGIKSIVPIEKPLVVLDLYNYIHEKNTHLITKVDAVIKQMKESGELASVIATAEKKIIEGQ